MTDDECRQIYTDAMELPNRNAVSVTKYIIATHTAKLLAELEMPEAKGYVHLPKEGAMSGLKPVFTKDQLQQYAAGAAAQAREQALDEAKGVCMGIATAPSNVILGVAVSCADAIDKLKGGE